MKNLNKINPKNDISNEFMESKNKEYVIKNLLELMLDIEYSDYSIEEIKKRVNSILKKHYFPFEDNYFGYELIDKFIDSYLKSIYWENFKKALNNPHQGDCVALPCSCYRCISEEFFKISTVTWNNKKEGYQLFVEYINNINNKK